MFKAFLALRCCLGCGMLMADNDVLTLSVHSSMGKVKHVKSRGLDLIHPTWIEQNFPSSS